MKRLIKIFLICTLMLLALSVTVSAATEGYYTYEVSNGEATITDVNTSISGAITIPSTLGGYPVTTIGFYAFYNCSGLTSVEIPDSVTEIGYSAFSGCYCLTNIEISDSVTYIDSYAFNNCTSLTNIDVSEDNENYCSENGILFNKEKTILIQYPAGKSETSYVIPDSVTEIGYSAFSDCYCLTNIEISDSVTYIDSYAFNNCTSLTNIDVSEDNENYCSENGILFNKEKTILIQYPAGKSETSYVIPDSVTKIGLCAFGYCTGLTSIEIPDSVTTIGNSAFYNCTGLTSVVIPDSVTEIGYSAFYNCTGLTSVVIPDSVTEIGYSAFFDCTGLTSVVIGDSVTTIGNSAFYNCTGLTSVVIPDSVTEIGYSAFYNCTGLTSVVIGDGVTTIGDSAFYGCDSLKSIDVSKDNEHYCSEAGVLFNKEKTTLIQYAIGKTGSYVIPNSVTQIGDYAFRNCTNLTSVVIGDSVTTIGSYAFYNCTGITSVYYRGNSIQWREISIGSNNSDLTSVSRIYNAIKIKAYDMNDVVLVDKYIDASKTTYKSLFPDKSGYTRTIYTNNTFTDTIDADLYVTEDVDVYVEYTPVIEFCGKKEIVPNDNFVQEIYFATEKKANYLICEFVYPDVLELNSITPIDFKYASQGSLKNKDGLNYLTVICQYADDESTVPENTSINPFDLSFTVSKTAKPQEIEIKFGEDTYLSGEEDYPFENKINAKIEILPRLASSVTIYGDSTIYEPYQYTAEVYPDYTTDKTIEWSVDDDTVATISKDGILTPVKNGEVTITATAVGGTYRTKTITVYRNAYVDGFKSDVGMWKEKILPDTKEYTIYVTEDTSVINITPLFTTGTLKYDNAVVMKNRPKEFELTEDETIITLARSDAGYLDCTYTIKVIKKPGLKNETIKAESFKEDCINILVYNNNAVRIEETEDITITIPEKVSSYKILYWESLANLKPVYAPIEKEL